jgi:CelD/BcsL family acetyltransferase involved in cellulose biosynthesis
LRDESQDVVRIDPVSDYAWRELAQGPSARVFHSPEWISVLKETYGFDARALVIRDAVGTPRAGIAYCRVVDDLFGRRLVSLPFSDYCDPLIAKNGEWNALMSVLVSENSTLILRCLHNQILRQDPSLTTYKKALWHGTSLSGRPEDLWAALHDSTRRAVEKARRSGVETEAVAGDDALEDFFQMHLHTRKHKYRLLAQPRDFFRNISRSFFKRNKGYILVARHRGETIAAAFFLLWNRTVYYKFNASDPQYLRLRPNDLLVWDGMLLAKRLGCSYWDFGLSDIDQEGLARFKRHFGTYEKEIAFLRHDPDGVKPDKYEETKHRMGQITNTLTEDSVPDSVTEKAGDILYHYFA